MINRSQEEKDVAANTNKNKVHDYTPSLDELMLYNLPLILTDPQGVKGKEKNAGRL